MDTLTPTGMKMYGIAYAAFLYDRDSSTDLDQRAEEVAVQIEKLFDAGDQDIIAKVNT